MGGGGASVVRWFGWPAHSAGVVLVACRGSFIAVLPDCAGYVCYKETDMQTSKESCLLPCSLCSYSPLDSDGHPGLPCPTPAVLLEATWDVGQPVTCLAPLRTPTPTASTSQTNTHAANGASPTSSSGGGDAGGGAASSLPPAFLIGTAGGAVQVVNTDRLPADATAGGSTADPAQLARSLGSSYDVKLFNGPVTAAAFSQVSAPRGVSCVRPSWPRAKGLLGLLVLL